jgi:hypothetical protein
VTKNGFTVHDGGALIRSKLNNLSFALNLKLKGSLIDLQNRAVRVQSHFSNDAKDRLYKINFTLCSIHCR